MATLKHPVVLIVTGCLASWLLFAAAFGEAAGVELPLGMLGPLVAVVGSWLLVEHVHRHNPAGVTAVMMTAFAVKMVYFGAYVVAMVRLVELRPVPFIVSFTGYFLTLYLVEALLLRRLFIGSIDEPGANS